MSPNISLPSVAPDVQRKVLRGVVVIGSLTLGYFVGKRIFRSLESVRHYWQTRALKFARQ